MSVSREIDLQSTIYTFTKIEYKLNMPDAEESQLMARIVLLLSPTLLVCFSTLINIQYDIYIWGSKAC